MRLNQIKSPRGQSALEYLLLFSIVAVVVLVGFKSLVPHVRVSSEEYFDSVSRVIRGEEPQRINGGWCAWEPCIPSVNGAAGTVTSYRTCECPTPAFGGAYCVPDSSGNSEKPCS